MSSLSVASFRHPPSPAGRKQCPPHVLPRTALNPPPTHTRCPGVAATTLRHKRISLYADDTQFVEITPTVTTTAWATFLGPVLSPAAETKTSQRTAAVRFILGRRYGEAKIPDSEIYPPSGKPGRSLLLFLAMLPL